MKKLRLGREIISIEIDTGRKQYWESIREASRILGVSRERILNVLECATWEANGYHFKDDHINPYTLM